MTTKLTDYQLVMQTAAENGWTVDWNSYNDRRQRVTRVTKVVGGEPTSFSLYFSWQGRLTSVLRMGGYSGCPTTGKREWLLSRLAVQ